MTNEPGWTGIATGWRQRDAIAAIEPNGHELAFHGDKGDLDGDEDASWA